jgi:glutathione S-transferase
MTIDESITLYRAVASRSFAAIWMLEELGVPYKMETVDIRSGAQKAADYVRLNPMGKVPTLVVDDDVVTEVPAICLFLADRYGYGRLAPKIEDPDRGTYLRWMVFSTAVIEPALILRQLGFEASPFHAGWGGYEDIIGALVGLLEAHAYVLGERFSAADVAIGAQIGVGLFTKRLADHPALIAYNDRLSVRRAHQKASAINWPAEIIAPAHDQ